MITTRRCCCLLALAVVIGVVEGGSAQAPPAVNAEARPQVYVVEAELYRLDRLALRKLGLDLALPIENGGILDPGTADMLVDVFTAIGDPVVERVSHPRVMAPEGQPASARVGASVIVLDKTRTTTVKAPLGLKWKVTTTAVGKDQIELSVEWDWSRLPAAANPSAPQDIGDVQSVNATFVARMSLGERVGYLTASTHGEPDREADAAFLLVVRARAVDTQDENVLR